MFQKCDKLFKGISSLSPHDNPGGYYYLHPLTSILRVRKQSLGEVTLTKFISHLFIHSANIYWVPIMYQVLYATYPRHKGYKSESAS